MPGTHLFNKVSAKTLLIAQSQTRLEVLVLADLSVSRLYCQEWDHSSGFANVSLISVQLSQASSHTKLFSPLASADEDTE